MARSSSAALGVYGFSRDDEKSSTAKTLDDDDSLSGQRTPSWATRSRKRSFADTGFLSHDGTTESGYDRSEKNRRGSEEETVNSHSSKKSRTGRWPLSTNDESPSRGNSFQGTDATGGQNASQASDGIRPSRFIEGSMNDRVSRAPPKHFVEVENVMEQYANGMVAGSRHSSQRQGLDEDGSKRSLGIFKFGKSVVTAFSNAFNYTTEMTQKLKPEREVHERRKREIREQKERYLAAYAAQKKSGGFDPIRVETHQKHDSGVHMGNSTSLDIVRADSDTAKGHNSGQGDLQDDSDAKGLAAETPSIRRPRVLMRGQSIANLRKAKSDAHLSNYQREPNNLSTLSNTLQVPKTLRKQPSKKDLQKQQKLSKKVSDLESKLELAKRQLQESLGDEIPPVPPMPQVPLGLFSNERVSLAVEVVSSGVDNGDAGHSSDEEEVELVPVNRDSSPEKLDATAPRVKATDMPEIQEEAEAETPELRAAQNSGTGTKPEAKKQATKKRKGNEDSGTFRPDPESESDFSAEPKEASPPRKRRFVTPRKPTRSAPNFKVPTSRSKLASKLPRPRSTSPPPSLSYSKPSPGTTTRSSSLDPANPSELVFAHHVFTATPRQDASIPPLPRLSKKMERILNIAANGGESPRPSRTGVTRGTTADDSDNDETNANDDDNDTGDTDELGLGKRVKNVDGTSVRGPADPTKKKLLSVALPGRGAEGVHVRKAEKNKTPSSAVSVPGRGEVVDASKAEEFEWDADIF